MFNRSLRAAALMLAFGVSFDSTSAALWRSDWTVTFAPASAPFDGYYAPTALQSPIAVTADGEVMLRTPEQSGRDDQIVRLDAAGNARWRVNASTAGTTYYQSLGAMLGRADGGAFVALSNGDAVASIDRFGNILWQSSADTQYLALDGSLLVVQGCGSVQTFDAATGQLLWNHVLFNGIGSACASGVVVDANGAIYAGFENEVFKFQADGTQVWRNSVPGRVMGVSGDLLYSWQDFQTPSTVALRAGDGSVAWLADGVGILALVGSPAEPVVSSSSSVQRLSAQTGAARWTTSLANASASPAFAYSGAAGDKLVIGSTQLDATSGTIDWHAALPGNGTDATNLATVGRLSSGNLVFGFLPSGLSGNPPRLAQVDPRAGAVLPDISIPVAPQALAGDPGALRGQRLVQVSHYREGGDFVFGVRALDAGSGALQWQTSLSPAPVAALDPTWWGSVISGDAAVMTFTANAGTQPPNIVGGLWVGAVDLSSGTTRWTTYLHEADATRTQSLTASEYPLLDADGNVVVAMNACYFLQGSLNPPYQFVQSVIKLSAADGSVLWRHDDTFATSSISVPLVPLLSTVGNDVYVSGQFAPPYDQAGLLKLSGIDGTVSWSANAAASAVRSAGNGNVIALGSDDWRELDGQTGAVLWSNPYTPCNAVGCISGNGDVALPNGDLYFGAQYNSRAALKFFAASAGAAQQTFALDPIAATIDHSYVSALDRAQDGTLWAAISRTYPYAARTFYAVQWDPVTHTVLRQQALDLSGPDALLDSDAPVPLAAPQSERLLVETFAHHPPQQPGTVGAALLDTTVTSSGNLALQVSTDKTLVRVGETIAFHLHVAYSGDAAIGAARLFAKFPWLGHATGVACSVQAAGNCVLDTRADAIAATFDMQPGGSIDITGQFVATDGADAGKVSAIVVGPIGLNELDISDNAAQVIVSEALFKDGFE